MTSSKRPLKKVTAGIPAKPKSEPRMFAFIPGTDFVEGQGFRVAFVVEGEDGYRPTGNWPYEARPGQVLPWFWGPTLMDAERAADDYNERRGIPKEEALKIIHESMRLGRKREASHGR